MSARSIVDGLMSTILISLVVLGAGLVILSTQGGRLLSVQSASMVPIFRPGDAIVVKQVDPAKLRLGDIISYHDTHDPRYIVTHRLVKKDGFQYITAGDVTKSLDKPISSTQLIGRAAYVLPKFGYILDWLKKPIGLMSAIFVPIAFVLFYETHRLSRDAHTVRYRLHDY